MHKTADAGNRYIAITSITPAAAFDD
eukprot:COSAG01_NODE_70626_length_258_cov_0.647799_1_plen_25_part_10